MAGNGIKIRQRELVGICAKPDPKFLHTNFKKIILNIYIA